MAQNRPNIPAEIRRKVLVEAGHRCAIHTCRYIEVELHHIISWEQCQSHDYENLIALCANCHRRADRGEIDKKALRIYKANLQYLHEKYSQLEMDILFELYNAPVGNAVQWPPFMHILIKRLLDSGFIEIRQQEGGVFLGGMRSNPDFVLITESGRNFVSKLGLDTL